MQLLFLSGSKTLLWSEIQRFSPSNMSCFFSLDRRGCFGAKLSDFSASNMQLFFFSLDRRGCFGAKLSEFSTSNMQLFFALDRRGCFGAKLSDFFSLDRRGCFGAKLCDFQHEHAAVFFSLAKRLLLDRFLSYFAPCSNNPFLPYISQGGSGPSGGTGAPRVVFAGCLVGRRDPTFARRAEADTSLKAIKLEKGPLRETINYWGLYWDDCGDPSPIPYEAPDSVPQKTQIPKARGIG